MLVLIANSKPVTLNNLEWRSGSQRVLSLHWRNLLLELPLITACAEYCKMDKTRITDLDLGLLTMSCTNDCRNDYSILATGAVLNRIFIQY